MKRLINLLRRPFRVQYHLTIIIDGKETNIYGTDRRLLTNLAINTSNMEYWTLYKRGPFGRKERGIDLGMRH